jgi:ubiquinone/menaquinone biosynthesis C-methylase UbiE
MPDDQQPERDGRKERGLALRNSYDTIAAEYTTRIYYELRDKPFDRELVDRYAGWVPGGGRVFDLGCGPGQIARYLCDRGVRVYGLDLSYGMLQQARKLNPDIQFVQGSMLSLPVASDALAGIAAFYSIIHIERDQVVAALTEMRRVLQTAGLLLLTFHLGADAIHETDLWGYRVDFFANLFSSEEMLHYLKGAGFEILEALERDPYLPEVEYQSRRGYILAAKS